MKWEAHPDVLDRDKAQAEGEELIDNICYSLCGLVNYGTNIVAKILSLIGKDNSEHVVLISFYRHILQMLDAVDVMVSQGVGSPCAMQIRSCFEHLLYMYHLVEKDSYFRAQCYAYMQLRRTIADLLRLRSTASKESRFEIDASIMAFEAIMDREDLREINTAYLSLRERDRYNTKWYSLFDGPNSIKQLAKHHGMAAAYENVYRPLSRMSHGQSFLSMFVGGEVYGSLVSYNLRDVAIFTRVREALVFGLEATACIIHFSIPTEMENFHTWLSTELSKDMAAWVSSHVAL